MLLTATQLLQEGRHKAELERRKAAGESAAAPPLGASDEAPSPFAAISATMGWETFHMVQMLWLGAADMPPRAPEKDWELQALPSCIHKNWLLGWFSSDISHILGKRCSQKVWRPCAKYLACCILLKTCLPLQA